MPAIQTRPLTTRLVALPALAILCALATPNPASAALDAPTAQAAAKATAKRATTKAPAKPATPRQRLKSEARGLALAAQTAETISQAQLDVAARVLTGVADCEFKQRISVLPVEGDPGWFTVSYLGKRYRMLPRETATGAVRLEDPVAGVVWLQIPTKSMLMNARIGQRLVDACLHAEQRAALTAAAGAAGGLGIVPQPVVVAAPVAPATAVSTTAEAAIDAPVAVAAAMAPVAALAPAVAPVAALNPAEASAPALAAPAPADVAALATALATATPASAPEAGASAPASR